MSASSLALWFQDLRRTDVARVGGKNASLGELIGAMQHRLHVPPGFATTAQAYWELVDANQLRPMVATTLASYRSGKLSLAETGHRLRTAFLQADFPESLRHAVCSMYRVLSTSCKEAATDVAVRSSATAEDLPDASFAGQQESFLNIRGEQQLLDACRRCYASLFTDRAISYREAKGFDHLKVALSIGVQKMVRADLGGAGVMFSIDTETGCDRVVLINAAWGLGENVVQGSVDPDEYQVFKPLLENPALTPIIEKKLGGKSHKLIYTNEAGAATRNVPTSRDERGRYVLRDTEILTLGRWACAIEAHYGMPMDMEWARDGNDGTLYIVQARPETVQTRRNLSSLKSFKVSAPGKRLTSGFSIGSAAVSGRVCLLQSARDIAHFRDGSILVTSTPIPIGFRS